MGARGKSQRQLLEFPGLGLPPSRTIFQQSYACFFGNQRLDWLILRLIVVVFSAVWQISPSFSTSRHMYKQMVGLYFSGPLVREESWEEFWPRSCKEKWWVTLEPDHLIAGVRSFRACLFPLPQWLFPDGVFCQPGPTMRMTWRTPSWLLIKHGA